MVAKSQKNVLLTKPIKVLRDTFTRHGNIGFTDLGKLSKWLENERLSHLEPDAAFWRQLYSDERYHLKASIRDAIAEQGFGAVFEQLARPTSFGDAWCMEFVSTLADPLRFMIKTLDWGRVKAYEVDRDRLALVLNEMPLPEAKVVHDDQDEDIFGELHEPDVSDVFDAALRGWNWWRGNNDWREHPLCGWMDVAIAALRGQAAAMFDEAVAVSQDGKRIQAAAVVVAYSFDAKKRLTFSLHQAAEFKERKIALGRIHVIPVKPTFRKKSDEQRVQDALKPRAVRKCVVELESHACHQAMLVLGKQRILFTPTETLPKQDSAPPAEPLFPRHENPFTEEPPADPNDMGVLDGIAPSPFEESPGGLTGPAFDGPDRVDDDFDMNTPVYYGPLPVDETTLPLSGGDAADDGKKVDCVDPAQKPPQRIEIAPPAPDATRDETANNDKPKS